MIREYNDMKFKADDFATFSTLVKGIVEVREKPINENKFEE